MITFKYDKVITKYVYMIFNNKSKLASFNIVRFWRVVCRKSKNRYLVDCPCLSHCFCPVYIKNEAVYFSFQTSILWDTIFHLVSFAWTKDSMFLSIILPFQTRMKRCVENLCILHVWRVFNDFTYFCKDIVDFFTHSLQWMKIQTY